MARVKQGYRAVRCGMETTEEGLAVLEFWRADGKIVVVTMTAESVMALSESLLSLLAKDEQVTESPSTTSEEIDDVTATG